MMISPRKNMYDYWSRDSKLENSFIKKVIRRDYFLQIFVSICFMQKEFDEDPIIIKQGNSENSAEIFDELENTEN